MTMIGYALVTIWLGVRFTTAAWDLPRRWVSILWLWVISAAWPVLLAAYLLLAAWMHWAEGVD